MRPDEPDPRIDAFIQKSGAEFEAAFREKGIPLPEGLTGEEFIRAALEEMEREHFSPEGQARAKRMQQIAEEVAAELSGGIHNPEFAERFFERAKDVLHPPDSGPAASA